MPAHAAFIALDTLLSLQFIVTIYIGTTSDIVKLEGVVNISIELLIYWS